MTRLDSIRDRSDAVSEALTVCTGWSIATDGSSSIVDHPSLRTDISGVVQLALSVSRKASPFVRFTAYRSGDHIIRPTVWFGQIHHQPKEGGSKGRPTNVEQRPRTKVDYLASVSDMSANQQHAHQGHYLAPSASRYASSSTSSASSPVTTPTTPTFPPHRDLTPSPVPSAYSAQTQGSSQTQYKVRVNPTAGNRVSSRSRQSSKGPASIGMGGLGYPGTVRGVIPPVNGPPNWQNVSHPNCLTLDTKLFLNQGHPRPSVYQTPSHLTPPYQSAPTPLAGSDLPPRTVHLANSLARSGRAPPSSVAPIPMRGSHFITPSGVQPMFATAPVSQVLSSKVEEAPHQRTQPTVMDNHGSGSIGITRPRSSTSSSNLSSRTINQSQIGMSRTASSGESSNHVTTPRKSSGTMPTAVSASSSSGSHRLISPPPPMPPPRDMPLPPLPPMPSAQSLPLVSATSSQSSLGRTAEKQRIVPHEVSEARTSELRGLGLGPVVSSAGRDPRMRDASAPAAMNGMSNRPHQPGSNSIGTGGHEAAKATARKMSSPPLGGLFSKLGGKSSASLNSTSGSSGKIRMTDTPSEFGVLSRGISQQVDSVPLVGPSSSRSSSYAAESSTAAHSLPVVSGKRDIPAVGIGRPSTSYYGARRSEDVTRQLLSSDISKDASKAVQPRKSSGGLKALFSRNKNKDRPVDKGSPSIVPPAPTYQSAPITKRRASEDMLRSRKLDLKPTEPLRLPVSNRSVTSDSVPSSVSALPPRRPSPPDTERTRARSTTPQPASSPPTPTAVTVARDRSPSEEPTAKASVQKLPPSISLHLGDLPQLDLSLGSTFDDLMKALDLGSRISPQAGKKASPLSPVKPNMHNRRRSRSFSDYSHSSSGGSLIAGETKSNTTKRKSRVESSASLAADLAAYRTLDVLSPTAEVPPSMLASSISDHDRTLSGASSVSGHSPPTTPVTREEGGVHIYTSQSSSSTDPLSSDSPADALNAKDPHRPENSFLGPTLDRFKPVRPSLLQVAESQRSTTTILEQDEVKPVQDSLKDTSDLSALGLAPPIEISVPEAVTSTPAVPKEEQLGPRQIRLPRKSRSVYSQYSAVELAAEMRRILVM